MPGRVAKQIVKEAEVFAKRHFVRLADPSHDWAHVERVRDLAFHIRGCKPLGKMEGEDDWIMLQSHWVEDDDVLAQCHELRCDYLVLELAALFHDLVDPKLFHFDTSTSPLEDQVAKFLEGFWDYRVGGEAQHLDYEQQERIIKIICNVGWSKDERRRRAHFEKIVEEAMERRGSYPSRVCSQKLGYDEIYFKGVYSWPEWRAISDADRIDAIGATGLLRCAAYSGLTHRPLLPTSTTNSTSSSSSAKDESAHSHILSKLLQIKGDRLFHLEAKLEAERRQAVMRPFVLSLAREMNLATPEEHRCDAACDEQRERVKRRRVARGEEEERMRLQQQQQQVGAGARVGAEASVQAAAAP